MFIPAGEGRPFVKWVGGKRSLLAEIIPRTPKAFNNYFEPFAGGGAVYFALAPSLPQKATLLDRNDELVTTYRTIKSFPSALLTLLQQHARKHSKPYYYRVRAQRPLDPVRIAARFLYLNKTCFNGLYRVNSAGCFNAPMGDCKNPNIIARENILACSRSLQKADIKMGDFQDIEDLTARGDFVYLDPPYHPLNNASFTRYTREDFNEYDQVRLRDFVVRLTEKGVFVMLSNSHTKFISDLYGAAPFHLQTVTAPRMVNCKPLERDRVEELLITNYKTYGRGKRRPSRSGERADPTNQPGGPSELHRKLTRELRF